MLILYHGRIFCQQFFKARRAPEELTREIKVETRKERDDV